ncbi:inverse autotransporter beta domain-containing protein [Proteus myxofaciens]|uniref:Invasin n=1 Tax=Proteus myxofaciens ATCC 19692 TaxID=1354337 RepID=A0A198G2Z4_9GAMM|nr:inverse autotransporter beta domain-containing protein [Proteus myxofaciens]OAT31722.1 hypothetical protein M983_1355 [Proteus myxofaciens ATCC 19692]
MSTLLVDKLRKKKFISYLLVFTQFTFPVALTITPAIAGNSDQSKIEKKDYSNNERWLAQQSSQIGSVLSSDNPSDSATQFLINQANSAANQEIESWLGKYGKARVNLGLDKNFSLKNTEAEVFIPFIDRENYLIFNQTSFHRTYDRNQGNLGFGARIFDAKQLAGFNTFFDHDFTGNNSRLGFGLEYRRDYLSLSSNYYQRLNGWKDSSIVKGYDERPANGWDIRSQAYLPIYPQLGFKANFEQYYGDDVDLFNDSSNRQKDPYSITAGINYTPVPLITVNAEHKAGKSGVNDSYIGMNITYQFGSSIKSQLDPQNVNQMRLLANSKYDFVDRNNNIVFDYRKQIEIRLTTPNLIEGYSNQQKTANISVTASEGLDHIDINANDFLANGGRLVALSPEQYLVYMPSYNDSENGNNTYFITAIAYDKKGNSSSLETTKIVVLKDKTTEKAKISATPKEIATNESSVITLQISNEKGEHLNYPDAAIVKDAETSGQLSNTVYNKDKGVYTANFIGGNPETAVFYGYYDSSLHQNLKTEVQVKAKDLIKYSLELKADDKKIILNNTTTLRLAIKDKSGQLVKVDDADILLYDHNSGSISETTYDEASGLYIATFTGTAIGDATFHPSINDNLDTETTETVNVSTFDQLKLAAVEKMYVGDTTVLDLTLTDVNGKPFKDETADIKLATVDGYTGNGQVQPPSYNNSTGTHQVKFYATTPGLVRFDPYVQNTPYTSESKDIEILSLAQKYDDVSLVATPTTIFQGETSQLKAQVKQDQKPLENGNVQITLLNGSGTISETKPVDGEPGAYTATYKGPSPTTANFGINIDDTPNNNAKAQVNVLGVSDVKATLEASKDSLDLQNGNNKQSVLTLKLTDKQNNPLNVSSAIIVENQPYKGMLGDSIKQSDGVYTAQFEANTEGQADFYAYANNINLNVSALINITDSTPTIDINKAAIGPNPAVIESKNASAPAGDYSWRKSLITLKLFDQNGKALDLDTNDVDIVIKNTTNGNVSDIKKIAAGEYTVDYTPTERSSNYKATFYAVIYGVRQESVTTSVQVEPLIIANGVNLEPSPNQIPINKTSTLTASFYDQNSQPIDINENVEIKFKDSNSNSLGTLSTTTGSGSTYSAVFTGKQKGTANFQVYVGGKLYDKGNSSTSVIVDEVYDATLEAKPSDIETNDQSTVTLSIFDHNNKKVNAGSDVQIILKNPDVGVLKGNTTFDSTSNTYNVIFEGTKAGVAHFSPVINGQNHDEKGTSVTVTQAPAFKTAEITPEKPQVMINQSGLVYLKLMDKTGNVVSADNVVIKLLTPEFGSVNSTIRNSGTGIYQTTFTGADIGTAKFIAEVNGTEYSNLTTSINVIEDPNAFYGATLTPNPSDIKVNNTSVLTLKVLDRLGNPTKAKTANILLDDPSYGKLSNTTWNESAKAYQATFSSVKVGSAPFSSTVNDKNTNVTTNVNITESFDSAKLTPNPSVITVGNKSELTLTLYDGTTPVRIQGDDVQINLLNNQIGSITNTQFDASNTRYKATFTGNIEGNATFNASVNGITRPNIQANVKVNKLFESATLTPDPAEIEVGNTSQLTLTFKDANGKNINVGNANIVLAKAGTGTIGATTFDSTKNIYTATFTGSYVGNVGFQTTIDGKINSAIRTSVNVTEVKKPNYQLTISSDPKEIPIGNVSTIKLSIKNAENQDIKPDQVNITAKNGSTYGTLGKTAYDATNKVYYAEFTGAVVGTETFYPIINNEIYDDTTTTVAVEELKIVMPSSVIHYTGNDQISFRATEGVPHVGTEMAEFEVNFPGSLENYSWSSNNSNVKYVGQNNKARFRFTGNPGLGKEITIVGVSKTNPNAPKATYTFILNTWFVSWQRSAITYSQAVKYCSDLNAAVPFQNEVYIRGQDVNTLKGEWGNLMHMPAPNTWVGSAFWLANDSGSDNRHYVIQPGNSNSVELVSSNDGGRSATCVFRK